MPRSRIVWGSVPYCTRCPNPRRHGKSDCYQCHAKAQRAYRKTHPLFGEAKMKFKARAYLRMYVKRGKIIPGPCEKCGAKKTEPHHDNYAKPLQVRWLCRKHHLALMGMVPRK